MNDVTIGTCGLCGGRVTKAGVWYGVMPQRASCERCGAYVAENHGPVLPMERPYPIQPAAAALPIYPTITYAPVTSGGVYR
jgi:hypothetical protein